MTYNPPALHIEQELVSVPDANSLPLHACILAPRYGLHRFGVEGEQALLGAYDADNGNSFLSWPGQVPGSDIDVSSSILTIQDAIIQYFTASVGSAAPTDGLLADDGNRIRFPSHIFKTGNGYDRSAVLGTRDVQLGDAIRVTRGGVTVDSVVSGIVADVDNAVVTDPAAADAGNAANTSLVETTDVSGLTNDTNVVGTSDATLFAGLLYGHTAEQYILTCTALGTVPGEMAGAVFSVVSVNGEDNGTYVAGLTTVAVALGAQGATLALAYDGSEDVQVGDTLVVDVAIAYAAPTIEAAGAYIGAIDTVYIVEVTQGGLIGTDTCKVKATTIHGSDAMPPTDVTADLYNVIGTQGLTANFVTGEALVTGDKYLITVAAAGAGAYRTLVLRDKLTGSVTTDVLAIVLSLVDTVDLGEAYWTASAAEIAVAAAAQVVGTYLGVQTTFNVLDGDCYIEYRELLVTGANVLQSLNNVLDVEDTLGPAVEANPLSLMVKAALTPADGTDVYYIQLGSDDLAGYTQAAEIQDFRLEPYGLVPYSTEQDVCDMLQASANLASSKERALYRQLIRGIDIPVYNAFYTEDNVGSELLATLIGTALVCANATFMTQGARAGDKVHINYQPDNKGGMVYDTYEIAVVVSDTELTVTQAPSSDLTIAVKAEVWRTSTPSEYADAVAAVAAQHIDRRVCAVWCDKLGFGGETACSKAILAAYIAGLRSAVAPHQPLSNYELSNIDIEVTIPLGSSQLNTMAGGGVWLVIEDASGVAFSRHQLTTDMQDVGHREQSITTNGDAIVRDFRDNVQDLYGKGNVSDEMLELIRSRLYSVKSQITARSFPPQIGPQLQDMTIEKLYKDPVNKDHIWCECDLNLPEPLNNLNIKFRIF